MWRIRMAVAATLLVLLTAVPGGSWRPVAAAPPTPDVVRLERGNGSIMLDLAPIPGSSVRYQARCVQGDITRTSPTGPLTTITVSGLTNDVKAECSARARRASAWSAWSSSLGMTPSTVPPTRPGRPVIKKMTPGAGQAILTVKQSSDDGGATVTMLEARCERDGVTRKVMVDAGTQIVVPGLTVNTEWTCSVRAINDIVPSQWSRVRTKLVISPSIAVGGAQTCVMRTDTTVACTGANDSGQLGDGSFANSALLREVSGLTGVVGISSGGGNVCAVTLAKRVWCWGYNEFGQLGDGSTVNRGAPVQVSGLRNIASVSAGGSHTCAVSFSGTAFCWGLNHVGQLGDGTVENRYTPAPVSGLTDVVEISAGISHTCARRASGSLYCWGLNINGRLGDGTTTDRRTPTAVAGIGRATSVNAGLVHTCAIVVDGTLWCWGSNDWGLLGDGTTTTGIGPVTVAGVSGAVAVDAAFFHTCALERGGTTLCWGLNINGELGDGTTGAGRPTAGPVVGVSEATGIGASLLHSCVSTRSGVVYCWGVNHAGQFGIGTITPSPSPTPMLDTP